MSSINDEGNESDSGNPEQNNNGGNSGYTPFDEIPYSTAQSLSVPFQLKNDDTNDGTGTEIEGGTMFTFGTSSQVEDGYQYSFFHADHDDDDDDYDETQPHEEVFYADGHSSSEVHGHELSVDSNSSHNHPNDNGKDAMDFNALAAQALQSLDLEYDQTIQSVSVVPTRPNKDTDESSISSTKDHSGEIVESFEKYTSDSTNSTTAIPTPTPTLSTTINATAISAAMKNISLKAPKLDHKFQTWKEQQKQNQLQKFHHPLIPHKQLMAFHRQSDKARTAAANLSRSATLAECIHRLFLNPNAKYRSKYNHCNDQVLVVHCVGADRVECQTRDTITTAFAPFVKWIHQYHHFEDGLEGSDHVSADENTGTGANANIKLESFSFPKHLRIELLGPNVPPHSEQFGTMNLLPAIPGRLESATVVCKNCMYHDYLEELEADSASESQSQSQWTTEGTLPSRQIQPPSMDVQSTKFPNIAIAYNAGIWGYTDWHPTLRQLDRFSRQVPFIITAYTLAEAEDDTEALEEVLDGDSNADVDANEGRHLNCVPIRERCLWAAEKNPFASRVERVTTRVNDNAYYQNGAWQAYMMGINISK